jgi:hypothetical protein
MLNSFSEDMDYLMFTLKSFTIAHVSKKRKFMNFLRFPICFLGHREGTQGEFPE